MISVNGLLKKKKGGKRFYRTRLSPIDPPVVWMLDSGAFTRICRKHGFQNHMPTARYAKIIVQFMNDKLLAAVAQDYMCEADILKVTGLTVKDHQRLTIHRYDRLHEELAKLTDTPPYIMPILQGYEPEEYLSHIEQYGDRLKEGMWVGVGSVCKRNANPSSVEKVLLAIKEKRPDLKLHGFGLKKECLQLQEVRCLLHSADSHAAGLWSPPGDRKARKYKNANNPKHLLRYRNTIVHGPVQLNLFCQS